MQDCVLFAIVRFLNTIVLWLDDEPSVASGRDSDGDGDGMIRVEGVSTDFSLFLSDGSTVRQAGVIEGQGDGTRYVLVEWIENTANTTASNSTNWEYVGRLPIDHAKDNGVSQQAIKYWDYTQKQYDFIAWSAGKKNAIYSGTPTDGQVLVSAITPATASGADGSAYVFKGKAKDLVDCYVADLVTVKKDGTGKGAYGEPVTLTFRSLGSKVRIGIYETIPGYSVKNVEFYSAAASDDADATKPRLFTTAVNQIYLEGEYTV